MSHNPEQAMDLPSITWLVSYPKSGSNWVRTFIAHYLHSAAEDEDSCEPIASSRLMFDRAVGVGAACLLPREIDALRPTVYRHVAATARGPLFLKVHDAWKRTQEGEPLFPAQITHATVYVVRNPLDMAVCAKHRYGKSYEDAVDELCERSFTLAKAEHGAPAGQLSQRIGDWSSHVNSWLRESDLAVHVMRYEDLLADPFDEFERMLEALDLEVDDYRLADAVEASGITQPALHEPFDPSWREELEPKLVQRIIDSHGAMMRELRYLDDRQRPMY